MATSMMGFRLLVIAFVSCALVPITNVDGRIALNGVFNSNMVLQRDHPGLPPVRIFGLAYRNETVTVTFTNNKDAAADVPGPFSVNPMTTGWNHWVQPLDAPWGNWSVNFSAPQHEGPYTVVIASKENTSDVTTIENVMFGEVFFCAGQSNMKLTVDATDDKTTEYAHALALGDRMRINFVGGNLSLDGPQISPNSGNWTVASGLNGTAIADFSAVCWDHGRLISEWLKSTNPSTAPVIGLIEVSVGGTTIHHWVPDYVGVGCNKTGMLPSKGECAQYPPGWIFDGRINPMTLEGNGISVRSVLYYQGEADSGENDRYTKQAYECELEGLVSSYRKSFGQPNLPVFIIQLPGLHGGTGLQHDNDTSAAGPLALGWNAIQLAQQQIGLNTPNVGLAMVPDYGCCGLHYGHKFPVAERAFNITREVLFNDTTIDNTYPMFDRVDRAPDGTINIHIINGSGLHLKDTYHCNTSFRAIDAQNNVTINATCCSSIPSGHEGVGIVKFGVSTTKQPRHYWGGWIPADIKIVSDSLITATPVYPEDQVNVSSIDMVDIGYGGMGCTIANSNGMPIGFQPPIVIPSSSSTQQALEPLRLQQESVDGRVVDTKPSLMASSPPPPPTPPAFCACDVCDDPNMLPPADGRIRIAALGDSITRGHPLKGKQLQMNYPCTLQRLLGDDKYVVFNFGAGGHTLLQPSMPVLPANKSVWNSTQFAKAMSSDAHVVLIMLGTNDAVKDIWAALGDKYPSEYETMIKGFQNLGSKPKVYALTSPPLYNGNFAGINQTVVNRVLPGLVHEVAATSGIPPPIDVFNGMGGVNLTHHDWFWGNGSYGCHPNMQGYQALAGIVYNGIKPTF